MKMLLLIVSIIMLAAFTVAGIIGCQLQPQLGPPTYGEFHYTTLPVWSGPPVRYIPIWVDKNFSTSDMESIKGAVDSWNFSLNGYIKLRIVDSEFDMEPHKILDRIKERGWLFMRLDSNFTKVPGSSDSHHWFLGFTNGIGGRHLYIIRNRLENNGLPDHGMYGIMMHEIGHLLGAGHVGQGLMYPYFTQARFRCIDWVTVWTVARYNRIPAGRLNYCIDGNETKTPEAIPSEPEGEELNCQP